VGLGIVAASLLTKFQGDGGDRAAQLAVRV
jgi:hypothetical protein